MKNPYKCKCLRCGHEWIKRIEKRPARCPNCKQPRWDVKARKKPERTWVYIARSECRKFVKIGYTTTPHGKLNCLKGQAVVAFRDIAEAPAWWHLLCVIKGGLEMEDHFCRAFKEARIAGKEWFSAQPEIVEFARIAQYHSAHLIFQTAIRLGEEMARRLESERLKAAPHAPLEPSHLGLFTALGGSLEIPCRSYDATHGPKETLRVILCGEHGDQYDVRIVSSRFQWEHWLDVKKNGVPIVYAYTTHKHTVEDWIAVIAGGINWEPPDWLRRRTIPWLTTSSTAVRG